MYQIFKLCIVSQGIQLNFFLLHIFCILLSFRDFFLLERVKKVLFLSKEHKKALVKALCRSLKLAGAAVVKRVLLGIEDHICKTLQQFVSAIGII